MKINLRKILKCCLPYGIVRLYQKMKSKYSSELGDVLPQIKEYVPKSNKYFFHISAFSYGNAGDTLLPVVLRDLFNDTIGVKKWSGMHVYKKVDDACISLFNKADALVIGGGGLFLKDTNRNDISGWQWPCSIECLKKIDVPVIMFAVGYNRFRGQEDFSDLFRQNINEFVRKAAFVGIRNNGSIFKLREYLADDLKDKLVFQPCMTTMISKIYPSFSNYNEKEDYIVINCAFDREDKRSLNESVLQSIARVVKELSKLAPIKYYIHTETDAKILPFFDRLSICYQPVFLTTPEQIIHAYCSARLVIGMRGHSQMIPFGCNTPILSIISHDKMKWFLEDIGHDEWGCDVLDADFESKLLNKAIFLYNNFKSISLEISHKQDILWEITVANIANIKNKIGSKK